MPLDPAPLAPIPQVKTGGVKWGTLRRLACIGLPWLAGPVLRTWMQEGVPPSTAYAERPGRWVGEPAWPSPHVVPSEHALTAHRIARPGEQAHPEVLKIESPLSVGQFAGKWASYNAPPDLPYDQRRRTAARWCSTPTSSPSAARSSALPCEPGRHGERAGGDGRGAAVRRRLDGAATRVKRWTSTRRATRSRR